MPIQLPAPTMLAQTRSNEELVLSLFRAGVTLGSGGDEHRLEMTRGEGSLKGVFKGQGCWGLPQ